MCLFWQGVSNVGALVYSMCKSHKKTQGFGEREDSERERCAVMCQVKCVWAQRVGTVLRFLTLGKECVQGRSPACTCTLLSPALSPVLVCVSEALSVFPVIIATSASCHPRTPGPSVCIIVQVSVSIFVIVCIYECKAHLLCAQMHMCLVCISLMSLSV